MGSAGSPLVYLNLASQSGQTRLREDPLISSLHLTQRPDDPRLLIALGEISGSSRPIIPRRLTRLADALILWLDDREWLVLPHSRFNMDLELALDQCFGDSLSLELIPDGSFHAELSEQAAMMLAAAESQPLNAAQAEAIDNTVQTNICIRPWTSLIDYDLLLTRADTQLLEEWLSLLQ
jgi:hypothetical protein